MPFPGLINTAGTNRDSVNYVRFSPQGDVLYAGIVNETVGTNTLQGVIYVYVYANNQWQYQLTISNENGASNDLFGSNIQAPIDSTDVYVSSPGNLGSIFTIS